MKTKDEMIEDLLEAIDDIAETIEDIIQVESDFTMVMPIIESLREELISLTESE